MELDYIQVGDYLLPALKLSDPPDAPPLGLYGELHKRYLREHKSMLYSKLLLSEQLYPLCREIDEAAQSRRKLGMSHDEIVRDWFTINIPSQNKGVGKITPLFLT